VHDLVDYVSEESARAGKNAARYVKKSVASDSASFLIKTGNGVRYTVPSTVRVSNLTDDLIIRFRSTGVFKDSYIDVLFDGERKLHRRKQIITPGEMEQVILKREDLAQCCAEITVTITEASVDSSACAEG
jgi:hypothetical protein